MKLHSLFLIAYLYCILLVNITICDITIKTLLPLQLMNATSEINNSINAYNKSLNNTIKKGSIVLIYCYRGSKGKNK